MVLYIYTILLLIKLNSKLGIHTIYNIGRIYDFYYT